MVIRGQIKRSGSLYVSNVVKANEHTLGFLGE